MRIICLGEALIDFISSTPGPLTEASNFVRCIGGAAVNVAAGLHAHNVHATVVSRVGRGQWGILIMNELEQRGLSTSFIQVDHKMPTKCCFISHDELGNRFIEIANRQSADKNLDAEEMRAAFEEPLDALYISGVMLIHEGGLERVMQGIQLAKQMNALILFDPVFDISRAGEHLKKRINAVLDFVDLLKVNESEYNALASALQDASPGPSIILHTKGAQGAEIISGMHTVSVDAVDTLCVDPTGAGDAFLTGFLVACLSDGKAMDWRGDLDATQLKKWGKAGALNAARVIQKPGGTRGYWYD